jgi:hypothetical protein
MERERDEAGLPRPRYNYRKVKEVGRSEVIRGRFVKLSGQYAISLNDYSHSYAL